MFTAAYLLLLSSMTGQYLPYTANTYGPGYGYGYGYGNGYGFFPRTPLPLLDPMRYNRFYSGEGYYIFEPPVIANPQVINLRAPAAAPAGNPPTAAPARPAAAPSTNPSAPSGMTGVVVALNEQTRQITLQLPSKQNTTVSYGPATHFLASDGNLPVIKPGTLINVNQNTITILRRGQ